MIQAKPGKGPIETRVIGGFLGAGKTTFVTGHFPSAGRKVAVLVNEFGELGIDGETIRLKTGLEVVEMPGGCICCSQREGLLASIHRIAQEIAPELLLIEPSGVAETSELLRLLSDRSLSGVIDLSAVVTVLDADTFLEFSEPEAFGLFFLDQVSCADLILINKCDLVTPETLDLIERRIALHNPHAATLRTRYCRLESPLPEFDRRPVRPHHPIAPLQLDCVSLVPQGAFPQREIARFLTRLESGEFGRILRGKGFIEAAGQGWLELQLVSGKGTLKEIPEPDSARLVLIGASLKSDEIGSYLRSMPS